MPAQVIQSFPPGLLAFFGIKNGGSNPSALAETLAPIVDLTEWYRVQQYQTIVTTSADWGAGNGLLLADTVPQNQVWIVRDLTVGPNALMAAGNSATICPALVDTALSCTMKLGPSLSLVAGGNDWAFAPGPFFIRPGLKFGLEVLLQVHALAQPAFISYQRVAVSI